MYLVGIIIDMMNNYLNEKEIRGGCCGRPVNYAPEQKCKCYDGCLSETCGKMPACIRNKQPDCLAKAVIPAVTVDTADGLTNLANCFVHVTSTNATFYIDDKHRPMMVWTGPVEISDYDIQTNPSKLRSQTLYTTIEGAFTEVYFDKSGNAHIMEQEA